MEIVRFSSLWRSSAWPPEKTGRQPPFINACALVRWKGSSHELLAALQTIEIEFGRDRRRRNFWRARSLDLDIIAHGGRIIRTPDLVLPHPRAHERAFVLKPLREIAPYWRYPGKDGLMSSSLSLASLSRAGPRVRAHHRI